MTVIYGIAIGILLVAAVLALWRILRGPSNVDRILASDVLVVILVCGVAVAIVATGTAPALPILMSLSLVGFLGAVSVARFMVARRNRGQR